MKTGEKKRLLGGIKKTKTMWEKWYEATTEEETTARLHTTSTRSGGNCLAAKKTHTLSY